jgi:hypothetical protein
MTTSVQARALEPQFTEVRSAVSRQWNLEPREIAVLATILVATIVTYLPSLRNGWVFDDTSQIVQSLPLHSWAGIGKSFIYDSWWFSNPRSLPQSAYYRPLQASWFGLNFMIFGDHPAAWHSEKIVLQMIGVILCFRLTQLLTRNSSVALLNAAIFALLPANVESVVWVSAIGEPLSTAFEMAALCCFINRKPGLSRGLIFALILYAGALLSHETAILFGGVVAAYVFLFEEGDESSRTMEHPAGVTHRILSAARGGAPFVILAALYMCARLNALGLNDFFGIQQIITSGVVRGYVQARVHHSLAQILMTLPAVLLDYLAVLAVPWMAGPTHAINWITHPQPLLFICAAVLLVISTAAFIAAWRSSDRRIYIFGAVWSVITIAPALNLNALWYLVDDRYLYAPSFGFCLAVGVALMRIAASGSSARKAVGAAFAIFLAASAISIMQTERYWHDDVTFFQRCVEIGPSVPDYRLKLAASLNKSGDPQAAARTLESAIALAPEDPHVHLMLAQQYQMMGREMDFEREFVKFNELSAAKIERQRAAEASGASQLPGSQ